MDSHEIAGHSSLYTPNRNVGLRNVLYFPYLQKSTEQKNVSILLRSMVRSSSPSIPPPISIPESFHYDAFLSFRGIDTRNNFISHLNDRLIMAGIHTFLDNDKLQTGHEIPPQLMRAIGESRIYIVVFSQNYASSTWCLDELVKMIDECDKNKGRVLLPVFYHVQTSHVRWRKGSFEEAFRIHDDRYINQPDLVEKWKNALSRAANFSGFDLHPLGSESMLVNLIIKEVLSHVNPKKLSVAKHPVGLDSRVNDVETLLSLESNCCVQFIGIFGMGGSGKSVIAKALYNKIYHFFDLSCFLANVRENSQPPSGLVHLQECLIYELLMREVVKVGSDDRGKEIIKERLDKKKVLIVLDDTDDLSQVEALAGDRNWFGPGSIIIITTRDQQLFNQVQVNGRYEAKKLNPEESLELLSLHSFKKRLPEETYAVTANKIVSYSCGLPLALEVLGASLVGKGIEHWKSAVKRLKIITPDKIKNKLKISYYGLDYQQREIFLDIACFFIGMDIDYVTEILTGCGFNPESEIENLKDRCLLTIDGSNELRMHDLLRDMGREIVREEFPKDPSKCSRLWNYQDIMDALTRNTGTEEAEGVTLVSPEKAEICLNTENFLRMHKLRLLQMDNVNLDGSFKDLFKKIKWISWQGCSLGHLPPSLQTESLVALDMQHSKMSTLWQGLHVQFLRHLKILNLSHSKRLKSTPDFNRVPSLKKLILEGCTSLVQIDPSIGCLGSLLVLNLKGCKKITNIPSELCSLSLLVCINLNGCSNLTELPDYLGTIRSLRELYADETAIRKLPASIGNLTSLSLSGCTMISAKENKTSDEGLSCLVEFNDLRRLNLRDCNLSDEDIPDDIGWYYGELRELDLAGNSLTKLPLSFGKLSNLESLWLDNWNILQSIPDLPTNLEVLLSKNIS